MKRLFYLILTLALSLSMVLCLASCGGDKDTDNGDETNENDGNTTTEKVNYTVTAVDDKGNPVKGVEVELIIDNQSPVPFKTDSEGKVTYRTAKSVFANVKSIPTGYAYDKIGKKQDFDANGNLKITLVPVYVAEEEFKITVVDQDGNAVEGVTVQICDAAGSCRVPRETDENGEAFYPVEDGTFYASLTNGLEALPEGYTVADPDAKYYFENNEVTIQIEKLN